MNTIQMYIIDTLSNMHVGSGEVNYGVIDNLIQRDPLTHLPNINASGLKGALREAFKGESFVGDLFGSEPKVKDEAKKAGNARFFEANLLSLPVRSDKVPYLMATSIDIIQGVKRNMEVFQCEGGEGIISEIDQFLNEIKGKDLPLVFDSGLQEAYVEELTLRAHYTEINVPGSIFKLLGRPLVILSHEQLFTLCDDNHLPVLARNNLEDGRSTNLWYEQVLPRYTRLYFMFMEGKSDSDNVTNFRKKLLSEVFQIGANASIGYGFCKIKDIMTPQNQ
ncbi:type III-B CRISPR module RAMP protein Cmr4 [Odoribacter splanchnicus]|uniref:type III-B CRISPR module RAMP protein Cmr4 n=1 Tax=Odoribacter splanchnicus TaxID=28118 RepID=UPI0034AE6175